MRRIAYLFLMKRLSLFFACVICCSSFAQNAWQALPNAPTSWRLDDCYFITPQYGWAISPYYSYLNPVKYGQVHRTTDGGNTWQLLKDSSLTFFRAVGFADSLNGWIGNLADTNTYSFGQMTPDPAPLYRTTDGGITWLPVSNIPAPQPAGICGISVVTDSVVYAYGRYFGPAVLIKSTDKGTTWTSIDMSAYADGLIDGYFVNSDTGFVSGSSNGHPTILSTFDGGMTWQVRYLSGGLNGSLWKLSFPSRNVGYGSIQMGGSATYFVKTIDGGLTWTEKLFVPTYNQQGIGFINDTVGWCGGETNGYCYKTTNGGNTWIVDFSFGVSTPPYDFPGNYYYVINRFRRFGDTLMYASGNTMYKLDYSPTSLTEQAEVNTSLCFYPNPSTGTMTIAYNLPEPCNNVILEIYSLAGEKIDSQNIGASRCGANRFTCTTNLAPGIYCCAIIARNSRLTGKLVIID